MTQSVPSVASSSNQVRRAYDLVRSLIRSGFVVADEQLVEDRLIKTLGVSRAGVREALQRLAAEGLVSRQRRTGTRVATQYFQVPLDDILPWQTPAGFMARKTDDRVVRSTPMIRTRLGCADPEVGLVEHVFEHVTADGVHPIGVRIAYFRTTFAQPDRWDSCPSLADAYEKVFGIALGSVESVIDAVACDAATARLLRVRPGSPLLVREQSLRDVEGVVQEYTFAHYRADRVSFPLHQPVAAPHEQFER